jgi:hypothetical protein
VRLGEAWLGKVIQKLKAWLGLARQGTAGLGMVRLGAARQGGARQGMAWQDNGFNQMSVSNEVILRHIERRIHRNANALILVVGDVGSGKTFFGLDFGLELSKRFGSKFDGSWVEFSPRPILEMLLREHKKGQPAMIDEMGVSMSNRRWNTRENVSLSFLFQTVRFKNHIVLFTVPDMSYVDVAARRLFHYRCIVKPRFRNDKNFVKIQKIVKNERKPDQPFYKPIPYKLADGTIKYAGTYTSTKPPQWLIDQYEEKRKVFIDALYQKLADDMATDEEKDEKKAGKKLDLNKAWTAIECGICHKRTSAPVGLTLQCTCGATIKG